MAFSFYTTVVIIAVVVLVLILVAAGYMITNPPKNANLTPFPPSNSLCPDYWTIGDDGSTCKPVGNQNLGTLTDTADTANPAYKGHGSPFGSNAADLNKTNNWATKYGVNWNGVTTIK